MDIEIINNAADKFKEMQPELCEFLFKMLREINALEIKIGQRNALIEKKTPGLNRDQISDEYKWMWSDFHDEYERIVRDKCTEKLLSKGYGNTFGTSIKYIWAEENPPAEIGDKRMLIFEMKAPRKAVIEAQYKRFGRSCASKFALIKQEEKWLVDAHNWISDYDNVWHRGHI